MPSFFLFYEHIKWFNKGQFCASVDLNPTVTHDVKVQLLPTYLYRKLQILTSQIKTNVPKFLQ